MWSLETRLSVEIFPIYLNPLAEVDRHIMQGSQHFWELQESLPPREFRLTGDDAEYILLGINRRVEYQPKGRGCFCRKGSAFRRFHLALCGCSV